MTQRNEASSNSQLSQNEIDDNKAALRYLRAWLKSREFTQRKIAAILGISEASVSSYIKGTQRMPVGHIVKIARALEVEPHELFEAPKRRDLLPEYRELDELLDGHNRDELRRVIDVVRALLKPPDK